SVGQDPPRRRRRLAQARGSSCLRQAVLATALARRCLHLCWLSETDCQSALSGLESSQPTRASPPADVHPREVQCPICRNHIRFWKHRGWSVGSTTVAHVTTRPS